MTTPPRSRDDKPADAEQAPVAGRPSTAGYPDVARTPPTALPPTLITPRHQTPTLPEQFGRYHILKQLGEGGMGKVYLARDGQLDRLVALKVPQFLPEHADKGLERFLREARAAATLHHPHICPIFDVGEIDGLHYLTMAYIDGQTLAEAAEAIRQQPPRDIAALVHVIALALEEAHAHGIIHRDLKPSNIMINKRHEPVIMDFGLARRLNMEDPRLSQQGLPLGTPYYMPPEQVTGDLEAMGPASDIYSLGVILYELLTGQRPFQGPVTSILAQIISQEPAPPSRYRADLDRRLEGICRKAMTKAIAGRFASMRVLAAALADYVQRGPTQVRQEDRPDLPALKVDAKTSDDVLALLRIWGWGMGLKKLKGKVLNARNDRKKAALQFLLDWVGGEPNARPGTAEQFEDAAALFSLAAWALAGQASAAVRQRNYRAAHQRLDQAAAMAAAEDTVLRATIAHTRAVVFSHEGKPEQGLPPLLEALTLFGKDHFATGRVLDTLGMVYSYKANFRVAREFFEQAILFKQRFQDDSGLALSHGQLGRLYLDWGYLEQAEEHFQADLRLAQKLLDARGEAQMYNHLGQLALARGEREAAGGRKAVARRWCAEAAGWLDESIRLAQDRQQPVTEGFARKDRALVFLAEGNVAEAEQQAQKAGELFDKARFPEGTAQVDSLWGMIYRTQERWDESMRALRSALAYFDDTRDHALAARVQWEIARTQRSADVQSPLVTRAFREALARAEGCRRDAMVGAIEEELREANEEAYFRHVYRRVRGRAIDEDTSSLVAGSSEMVTALFFDLQGFTDYSRGLDPEDVMLTLNQIMADLAAVLEKYRAKVTNFFGDGFLAVVREARHAERAVQASLDLLAALQELNRPRQVLGMPLFQGRIGINTGSAFLGNVGTYHKMDYTAVGAAVGLAARLLSWAEPGLPCISRATHELVEDYFVFHPANPRSVTACGVGPWEIWDVAGRKQ